MNAHLSFFFCSVFLLPFFSSFSSSSGFFFIPICFLSLTSRSKLHPISGTTINLCCFHSRLHPFSCSLVFICSKLYSHVSKILFSLVFYLWSFHLTSFFPAVLPTSRHQQSNLSCYQGRSSSAALVSTFFLHQQLVFHSG